MNPFLFLIMAKNKVNKYLLDNEEFLTDLKSQDGIRELSQGVLYKVLNSGSGKQANPRSVVSVFYKGSLISGKVFDNNFSQGYPDAFRLTELIAGWQIAIAQMREGDRWIVYVPAALGYGSKGVPGIPGHSTLIFEIELITVM